MLASGNCFSKENPWEKVESTSDITIYERWIDVSPTLSVRERKCELQLKTNYNKVIGTLVNPAMTSYWMENVNNSFLIEKVNETKWYSYTSFAMPWPFDNRDLICVSSLKHHSNQSASIEIVSCEYLLPLKHNVKRLTNYKATWKIVDVGKGFVNLSFTAVTYKAPEYPRIIQDKVVRGAFLRSMLKLSLILTGK